MCVDDVAALVETAVVDPGPLDTVVEIGGSDNLGLVELATIIGTATDTPLRCSHIPTAVMPAMSVLLRPVAPGFARRVAASVVMDPADMTFDAAVFRSRHPALPSTSVTEVIRREFVRT